MSIKLNRDWAMIASYQLGSLFGGLVMVFEQWSTPYWLTMFAGATILFLLMTTKEPTVEDDK